MSLHCGGGNSYLEKRTGMRERNHLVSEHSVLVHSAKLSHCTDSKDWATRGTVQKWVGQQPKPHPWRCALYSAKYNQARLASSMESSHCQSPLAPQFCLSWLSWCQSHCSVWLSSSTPAASHNSDSKLKIGVAALCYNSNGVFWWLRMELGNCLHSVCSCHRKAYDPIHLDSPGKNNLQNQLAHSPRPRTFSDVGVRFYTFVGLL